MQENDGLRAVRYTASAPPERPGQATTQRSGWRRSLSENPDHQLHPRQPRARGYLRLRVDNSGGLHILCRIFGQGDKLDLARYRRVGDQAKAMASVEFETI